MILQVVVPGPADLLPSGYEFLDGQFVEKVGSAESSLVAVRLTKYLGTFIEANDLGVLLGSECPYQLAVGGATRIRKPDISFIRKERLPAGKMPRGTVKIAPDLAVEVHSANDMIEDVLGKMFEYLDAGVPLVWLISPATKCVFAVRTAGPCDLIRAGGELSGGDVVPGFRVRVDELFAGL